MWTRAQIESVLGRRAPRDSSMSMRSRPCLIPTQSSNPRALLESCEWAAPGASGAVEQRLAALAPQRRTLLEARDARPQPARDEKLLVGLNGLAIEAFALSSRTFRTPRGSSRCATRCRAHLVPVMGRQERPARSSDLSRPRTGRRFSRRLCVARARVPRVVPGWRRQSLVAARHDAGRCALAAVRLGLRAPCPRPRTKR